VFSELTVVTQQLMVTYCIVMLAKQCISVQRCKKCACVEGQRTANCMHRGCNFLLVLSAL